LTVYSDEMLFSLSSLFGNLSRRCIRRGKLITHEGLAKDSNYPERGYGLVQGLWIRTPCVIS
jgi:hypothetical protein